ncbi:Helix-turn-helix domain protein [uncultured archaeon]|nr:Helix-turn-helix domain protein [uncultured archaeon]
MNDLPLTKTEFKALSSDTRTSILKSLGERNYTLSELSAKLGMSAPTIKEHADILAESGMIELRDEGRKWKYYALTQKGRAILNPEKKQINILLVLSSIGAFILIGILATVIFSGFGGTGPYAPQNAATDRYDRGQGGEEGQTLKAPVPAWVGGAGTGKSNETGTAATGVASGGTLPAAKAGTQDTNTQNGGADTTQGAEENAPTSQNTGQGGTVQVGTPFIYENPNCTPNFTVIVSDAGTNISEKYADYCYRATTESDCKQIDYYDSVSNEFGEGDGISDCSWKQLPN